MDRTIMIRQSLHAAMCLLLVLACGLVAEAGAGQKTLLLTKQDLARSAAAVLELNFEISDATLSIIKIDDNETIVRAAVTYGEQQPEPTLATASDNTTFQATFASGDTPQTASGARSQQWTIAVGTYAVPTDLTLACTNADGAADWGGLPLRSCAFLMSGADMTLSWDLPVQDTVEVLIIAAGTSTITLRNTGNTNFSACGLLGGGNTITLDLNGALAPGDHALTMIQAHDTISVTVPDAVGARVKSLAILSTLAFAGDGWQQQYRLPLRQGYITADYASRDITATLDITALKTGIDIRRGMP
jgi:hypothetical protein